MGKKSIMILPDKISTFPNEIGIKDIPLLGKLFYKNASIPLPMHTHENMMEICYLYKGKQNYILNNKQYTLYGGDMFITYPWEMHGTGTNPEEKSVLYWMHVDLSNSKNFIGLPNKESKLLYDSLINLNLRLFKIGPSIKNLFDEFIEIFMSESPLKIIKLKNILISILLEIVSFKNNSITITTDINNALIFIKNNIGDPITIESLSRISNLSESRFKQKFKEQIGIPPNEYIWRKKVDCAKQLLKTTDSNLTEIAYRLNFGSSQYFSNTFKKYTGMSPSQYKKQNYLS